MNALVIGLALISAAGERHERAERRLESRLEKAEREAAEYRAALVIAAIHVADLDAELAEAKAKVARLEGEIKALKTAKPTPAPTVPARVSVPPYSYRAPVGFQPCPRWRRFAR